MNSFLQQKKLENLKPTTIGNYYVKLRIVSKAFSNKNFNETNLFSYLSEYQSSHSEKSMRDMVSLLNSFCTFCYNNGYLRKKIVLKCPKISRTSPSVFNYKEQAVLEHYLLGHLDYTNFGILLSLYTGIRIGELCGLRISDFKNESIKIKNTIQRITLLESENGKKTKLVMVSPKTESSKRTIPLTSTMQELLLGMNYADNTYILTGSDVFREPRSIERVFKKVLDECNIRSKCFHTLRHTFATNLIEAGIDPKTVAELLGHASVATTLQLYVHPSTEYKAECISQFQAQIKEKLAQIPVMS